MATKWPPQRLYQSPTLQGTDKHLHSVIHSQALVRCGRISSSHRVLSLFPLSRRHVCLRRALWPWYIHLLGELSTTSTGRSASQDGSTSAIICTTWSPLGWMVQEGDSCYRSKRFGQDASLDKLASNKHIYDVIAAWMDGLRTRLMFQKQAVKARWLFASTSRQQAPRRDHRSSGWMLVKLKQVVRMVQAGL